MEDKNPNPIGTCIYCGETIYIGEEHDCIEETETDIMEVNDAPAGISKKENTINENISVPIMYMDLIEIIWADGVVRHIPAPFFENSQIGVEFLFQLPRRKETRKNMFSCPSCGEKSDYAGYCQSCSERTDSLVLHNYEKRHQKRKQNLIDAILNNTPIPKTIRKITYVLSYRNWEVMGKW